MPKAKPSEARVEKLKPLVVKPQVAGEMIGRSTDRLSFWRNEDLKRKARGEKPLGPEWIVINGRVYYELVMLERWVQRNGVRMGAAKFFSRATEEAGS